MIPHPEKDRLAVFIRDILPGIHPDIRAELIDAFRAGYSAGHTDGYDRGRMDICRDGRVAATVITVRETPKKRFPKPISYRARVRRLYAALPCTVSDIPNECRTLLPDFAANGKIAFDGRMWNRK